MALGRSLTKKLKRSVSKKFSTNQPADNEFYAISFNETEPGCEAVTYSNSNTPTPSTTMPLDQKQSVSRTNSINSLLSRKSSLRKTKTPSASKPPSMVSSPSTPIPTSHPITPTSNSSDTTIDDFISYSKAKIPDYAATQTIPENPLSYDSFSLKYPPTHRKVLSTSSSLTAASSCYSSVHSEQQSLHHAPYFARVAEDDTLADEMAMEILEKISAQEYVHEIESGTWTF